VFPVPKDEFYAKLNEYISSTETGQREANAFEIGLNQEGKMVFSVVQATAIGNISGVHSEKMKVWNAFKELVNEWNGKAEANSDY